MNNLKGRLLYLLDSNTGLLFFRMSFFLVNLTTGKKTVVNRFPIGKKTALLS